ncbi:unnamed protein product, partial [Hymenolepis diminuta]
FFYKNLVFTLTQILFGIFSLFSSQSIYDNLYLLIYNITMTSIPIIFYGIFEQRLPESTLMTVPDIYMTISRNKYLSWMNFFTWTAFSVWHGIVIFFGTYFLATEGVSMGGNEGNAIGVLEGYGSFMIDCVFIGVTIKLVLVSYHYNAFLIISVIGTLVFNFCVFILANFVSLPIVDNDDLIGVWTRLGTGNGAYVSYLALFVLFGLCFVPDLLYRLFIDSKTQYYLQSVLKSKKTSIESSESSSSCNGAVNCAYYGSLVNIVKQQQQQNQQHHPKSVSVDPSSAYLRRIQENQKTTHYNWRFPTPDYPGTPDMAMTSTSSVTMRSPDIIRTDDPYYIPRPSNSSEYRRTSPQAFLQRNS